MTTKVGAETRLPLPLLHSTTVMVSPDCRARFQTMAESEVLFRKLAMVEHKLGASASVTPMMTTHTTMTSKSTINTFTCPDYWIINNTEKKTHSIQTTTLLFPVQSFQYTTQVYRE